MSGFLKGTLVHTEDGLKPIEKLDVGTWVLSRAEDPTQLTAIGYRRVTKTFRFEHREMIRFWWLYTSDVREEQDRVYASPAQTVWLNPNGWVPMGRLHLPGKLRPDTIHRGDDEWLGRELVLADGHYGSMLDVSDFYRTNEPNVAFREEDEWGLGRLLDFTSIPPEVRDEEVAYDYERWGNPAASSRERYTMTGYSIEVEEWHTFFVGKTGVWVHTPTERRHAGP